MSAAPRASRRSRSKPIRKYDATAVRSKKTNSRTRSRAHASPTIARHEQHHPGPEPARLARRPVLVLEVPAAGTRRRRRTPPRRSRSPAARTARRARRARGPGAARASAPTGRRPRRRRRPARPARPRRRPPRTRPPPLPRRARVGFTVAPDAPVPCSESGGTDRRLRAPPIVHSVPGFRAQSSMDVAAGRLTSRAAQLPSEVPAGQRWCDVRTSPAGPHVRRRHH